MSLKRYIARRSVYTIVLLLVIIAFNFVLFQILPFTTSCPGVDYNTCVENLYVPPAPVKAGNASAQLERQRELVLTQYGFTQPLPVRFVLYFINMLTFNFGFNVGSVFAGSVVNTIIQRLPYTLLLLGSSTVAAFLIGIGMGIMAAARRGKVHDVLSLAVLLFFNSIPTFWLGGILIVLEILLTGKSYVSVGTLTLTQQGLDAFFATLQAMVLPFITLTLVSIGGVFLIMRATMIDVLAEDYINFARAKGLDERTVLFKHAFRNGVIPVVTIFGLSVGFILAGAVITETVFDWPGLGTAIYQGVLSNDFPLEQAIFYIIAITVLLSNFTVDILYGYLDPRIRTG